MKANILTMHININPSKLGVRLANMRLLFWTHPVELDVRSDSKYKVTATYESNNNLNRTPT